MKKYEDTICNKVSRCIESVNMLLKDGTFDMEMGKILHSIREDAQAMENGLKRRKAIMVEAGLENKYQKAKKQLDTPPGINKIVNATEQYVDHKNVKYEFIVKDHGEVIYQNEAFAGVACFVEEISDFDEQMALDGQTQRMMFGHNVSIWFAFDQLEKGMEGKKIQISAAIKKALMEKTFSDPKKKQQLIDLMNGR